MGCWQEAELGNIASYVKDRIEAANLDSSNYISTDNMLPNVGGITLSDYVPTNGKVLAFSTNDVLVSNIRPYFKKIWKARKDGGCSNDVLVFRADPNQVRPDFLYYYLSKHDFFDFMMAGANGVKMPRGNKNLIPKYKLLLPPLPTQQKIAAILSAYDDLIENNLKRIKLLEEMAQITYEEWFVRMRFPGYESILINSSNGLPEGWILGQIGDLVGFQNGFAFKSSDFTKEGFPVIKIKNIGNNTVDVYDTDFIDAEVAKAASKFKLSEGDLLIAMTGATIGKTGFLPFSYKPCYLNQRVGKFLSQKEFTNIPYIFAAISGDKGLQQVLNLASGAAQPNISGNQILSIKCVIPAKDILRKYISLVQPKFDLLLILLRQNQRLREARDILLPRLMTGVIDVESYNPADLLKEVA